MSFGFGVGDFLAVIELARKVQKSFCDAPSQFKELSDSVRSLSIALYDIDAFSDKGLNTHQQEELGAISRRCMDILEKIKVMIEKYAEIKPGPDSSSASLRRVWKRLKWEPDDVRELRALIIENITYFNAFQGKMTSQISQATKDGVDRLHQRQDDRERQEKHQIILDWLSPIDYTAQQSDYMSRYQQGTGQWLLESPQFTEWLQKDEQTLFCPGIPGAGKTILASVVINELINTFGIDESVGIAYLYCNFKTQDQQDAASLISNLLKQLAQGQAALHESVISLYKSHRHNKLKPLIKDLLKTLKEVASSYSRLFIVVDALDECKAIGGQRENFLDGIFELQASCGANIFATSRFIPEVVEKFEHGMSLEIKASEGDTRSYVGAHISNFPSFVRRDSNLQEEISDAIVKATDGMFLLAQLHLGSLVGKRSPKALRSALATLPSGSKAYDEAYESVMTRIDSQLEDQIVLAKDVLSWIVCAKRPLTTTEVQAALAVEIGESRFDPDNLSDIEDTVSVCAGLVTVDEQSEVIRLVHYTTQEYLERTQSQWFPNANDYIARICITYLSFDEFETGCCKTVKELATRLRRYPLYEYAACNWGYHARRAPQTDQVCIEFLKEEAKVDASVQALIRHRFPADAESECCPRRARGLHLAAYFGIESIARYFAHNQLDSRDSYDRTPLSWAAEMGHANIVDILLATGKIDVNARDSLGQTPLCWSTVRGHTSVVERLLATGEVDVNIRDKHGWSATTLAIAFGSPEVVERLLATGQVNFDKEEGTDKMPLRVAVTYNRWDMVELLLAIEEVDANAKDEDGETALMRTVALNKAEIVEKLLASERVDCSIRDKDGWTALTFAVAFSSPDLVKQLLASGKFDVYEKDDEGRDAFDRVTEAVAPDMIQLLESYR